MLMRPRHLFATLLLACIGLLLAACAPAYEDPSDYSLLLVTLDTTRADHIGAYGGQVATPTLDRLAAEGVVIDTAISQAPLTLPAHSSVFTGQYPATHGVRHNGIYRLPPEKLTLAEQFQAAGFQTSAFVGAYVLDERFGLNQGFTLYDGVGQDTTAIPEKDLFQVERSAEEVNAAVFNWLDQRPPGRFFAWVHYYDPHKPYAPPAETTFALEGEGYDREISYVDASLGALLANLRARDLAGKTVVLVVGDHGESLGEHREQTHGVFLYEPAVHVPMIFCAPGLLPQGTRVGGIAELVDIAPTLIDLLNLPSMPEVQGKSLLPRLRGNAAPEHELAFAEAMMPRIDYGWSSLHMVRDDRYKFISAPEAELYDLKEDPGEEHNLFAAEKERSNSMAEELTQWRDKTRSSAATSSSQITLSEEEEARLRSLGYLGGGFYSVEDDETLKRPDPKRMIEEARSLFHARDLIAEGHAESALPILEGILEANPLNHVARRTLIQASVGLNRLGMAEEQARRAIDAARTDPDASDMLLEKANRSLASILWKRGQGAQARQYMAEAAKIATSNNATTAPPGVSLSSPADLKEAERVITRALESNPEDPNVRAAHFEFLLAAGRREEAVEAAAELARRKAGDAETLARAGHLLRESDRAAEAALCFQAALEQVGENADLLGFLGTAELAAGRLSQAEEALRAVLRLRPEDPRSYFFLGNIALIRRDEAKARGLFNKALERDPQWVAPLVNLARFLAATKRPEEAKQTLQDALQRVPDDPAARDLLNQLQGE